MSASTIEEISKIINTKLEEIINNTEDVRAKETLIGMYNKIKNIESITLTQNQLTNEKEQENMNLKKEIELLKSNLEFAMGKDVSDNQAMLEAQAKKEMVVGIEQPSLENEELTQQPSTEATLYRLVDQDRLELRVAIKDHETSKEIERICDETLGMVKTVETLRNTMNKKDIENIKLKEEISKLQLSLDFAMGKVEQGPVEEEARVEMHIEEMENKFR